MGWTRHCAQSEKHLYTLWFKIGQKFQTEVFFLRVCLPDVLCCTELNIAQMSLKRVCIRGNHVNVWSWFQKSGVPDGKLCVNYIIWSCWLGPMKLNLKSPNCIKQKMSRFLNIQQTLLMNFQVTLRSHHQRFLNPGRGPHKLHDWFPQQTGIPKWHCYVLTRRH